MHAQVTDRKMQVRSGAPPRDDGFSILVRANEEDGGKLSLNDTELVSHLLDV
jgi:cytochrome P450